MNLPQSSFQLEATICFFIWLSGVLYSIYCFGSATQKYFKYHQDDYDDFTEGWTFISRKKDIADHEWQAIKFIMRQLSVWIFIHIAISEVLRKFRKIQLLQLWQILITILFITKQFGLFSLFALLLQAVIFSIAYTWRSKLVMWLCNGVCLLLISLYPLLLNPELIVSFQITTMDMYWTLVSTSWLYLKCTSYYLDLIEAKNNQQTLIDFFSYCLYLPTFFLGPFIPYKDFKNCYEHKSNFIDRISLLIFKICRFLFWLFFTEFCLHFIYVNATAFHPQWVKSLNSWSFYGYGYTMGQFFHLKYVVIYGLSLSFAEFENVNVPSLPCCIGSIYLYSDMWRYFDNGLYKFLTRYVYVPAIKVVKNRLLAGLFCFIFVYVWHGIADYIFIWSVMNYVAIVLENVGEWINNRYLQNMELVKKMGPIWFRRISTLAIIPLLIFSALSNFYFFARTDMGNTYLLRVLNENPFTLMIFFIFAYCCCQASAELRVKRRIAHHTKNENKELTK